MSTRPKGALARLTASIALVVIVLFFATGARAASEAGSEAKPRCIGADQAPKQATLHYLRSSVLCLVNRVRLHYGLNALHYNPQLRSSATGHSRDMVVHRYLGHDGPSGSTVGTRVASAGYLARVSTYFVGENIGGGPGQRAGSAMAVFRAWMQSPPHRANILDAGFHDFGAGVARGYPAGGGAAAATYTLDFGTRH
jgi:uncharacterized protein YkwD